MTALRFPIEMLLVLALVGVAGHSRAQRTTSSPAFEVATIKPVESNEKAGRYIVMQGNNRFVVKYYTLKLLIAAAYDLSPKVISGGPAWCDSDISTSWPSRLAKSGLLAKTRWRCCERC